MGAEKQAFVNQQNTVPNTPESFGYTAPTTGFGSKITAVNVSNDSAIDRTYKAYIVESGGTAVVAQVPVKTVNRNQTDQPPELIGQVIPPGGTIQFESSAAASLTFSVTIRDLD